MWGVLVQDMLEEENPDLYRKMQMDGTLTEYVKGNAAIMADAVKSLSPRGDPMSTSEAHEIVIAEMRAQIRRGAGADECEEEADECEEVDMLDIKEVCDLGFSENPTTFSAGKPRVRGHDQNDPTTPKATMSG